jgi:hypothetical protein
MISRRHASGRGDRTTNPRPTVERLGRWERTHRRNAWYHRAKATEHGERDTGSRSAP